MYDFERVEHTVKTFGQVIEVNRNHYELKPVGLNESNSSENNTPSTTPVSTPFLTVSTSISDTATKTVSPKVLSNGMKAINEELDGKKVTINNDVKVNGGYVEVKKPR